MFSEGWFARLCGGLDSPGGHMLAGFALVAMGGAFAKFSIPKAEELIIAGVTIVGFATKGQNGKGAGLQTPTK